MNMILSVRSLFWVVLLLSAPAWSLDGSQVERYLQSVRLAADAPGVSAVVMVRGELVYSGGVGTANLENGMPQDGTVVHNIGSISKTMAAVAVMQLVEQGKVDLSAEIQRYAPWFPRKREGPITIREIMTHTSGIRHYRDGEFGEGGVLQFRQFDNFEESTRRWRDDPLLFTPGHYWSYSSYAIDLLQAVVEAAGGSRYEEYLRQHVWGPAGMLDTQLDVPSRIVLRRGRGYVRNDKTGVLENAEEENVSYKYAGGGVISTDEDLARFAHALNAGVLLKSSTVAEMFHPQLGADISLPPNPNENAEGTIVHPPPSAPEQGLVWFPGKDRDGRPYVEHDGAVKGTVSELRDYVDDDIVVAVHANGRAGSVQWTEVVESLAQLAAEPLATGKKKPAK